MSVMQKITGELVVLLVPVIRIEAALPTRFQLFRAFEERQLIFDDNIVGVVPSAQASSSKRLFI